MHPSSSSNSSANIQQPWQFDESIYPDIIAEQNVQDDRPYRLIKGGPLDYKRVWKLYDESPIPGYTIGLVEVIYDQRIQERFEVELSILEQRASESAAALFQSTWSEECASPEEKKTRQYVINHLLNRSQTPLGYRHVKVVSMFHATKQAFLDSIFRVGFTVLAKKEGDNNDPGYFGKGIYHTSSAEYAYRVYGSDNILLYNWASYFAAYPVIDIKGEWLNKIAGKEHYKNYDAHYVLVNSLSPNDPNENSYFPIQDIQDIHDHSYDELVTFQSNQILPRYIVHLEPTGLNLKQVPTKTDSIFDSILGLFSTKIELTVGTLLQEIDNYLKSTKRIELEKSLRHATKEALETELKRKIITLSKGSKKLLTNEEAWILRQLLCIQKNKNEKIAKLLLNALCARIIPQDVKLTFVGLLCTYYKSKNAIPRLFKAPLHIEQNYVQLVLVEGQNERYTEKLLVSSEDIPPSINLTNLFDPKKQGDEAPKHLAIIGRAGIGKSTLCQYVCYQWANGKLWNNQFEALIWIPLRQLINAEENDSLYDLIRRFCVLPSGRKEISSDQIKEYLFQREEKVLFVLDGYDEISNLLQKGSFIGDLMQELLQQKNWLITLRPHAAEGLRVDRTFENIGFSSAHVNEYITKNLFSKSYALENQLKRQPWLSGMAHVPLNLELICSTWECDDKVLFASMSTLYIKFTLDLLKRFLLRQGEKSASGWELDDFESEYSAELQFLEQLAWEGLVQKRLVMPLKDEVYRKIYLQSRPINPKKRNEFDKTILEMGLIRTSGASSSLSEQECEFSHLTFQEFFAAKYICRCISEQNVCAVTELIQLHKYNPQFQLVWSFAAGILKEQPEKLRLYFRLLDEAIDLAGFYDFQLKMRCLEEVGWSKDLPNLDEVLKIALDWMRWVELIPKFIDNSLLDSLKINLKMSKKLAEQINFSDDLRRHIKIYEDFYEVKSLMAYLQDRRFQTSHSHALKIVFETLSLEQQEMYASKILKSIGSSDRMEDVCRELLHKTQLLVTLAPRLLESIPNNSPGNVVCSSSVLLLGMADATLLNDYPQIVSILIRMFEQNEYKNIHPLIFESLIMLLLAQSENEQIYVFFSKLKKKPNWVANHLPSLRMILKNIERSISSNHKNVKLLEKILIASVIYGLSTYQARAMEIIAAESSGMYKKLCLGLVSFWIKEQVFNPRQGVPNVSSFLKERASFYWKFHDGFMFQEELPRFNSFMCRAIIENHDAFLDIVLSVFEKENTKIRFRAIKLISSIFENFAVDIYLRDSKKIENLLISSLTEPDDVATASALLGLIARKVTLTPELTISFWTLFKTSYKDPKYPRVIAAHNLCSFACLVPQLVHEILPILSHCLRNQNKEVSREALSALKNAFWKDSNRKEIGKTLYIAFKHHKIPLKDIRKELLVFTSLCPEKKQELASEVYQRYKDRNLDQFQSIVASIDNMLLFYYQFNSQVDEFFQDIYFLYELLLRFESPLKHEKQHILNNLLALLTHKDSTIISGFLDCFTMILFSEPESSKAFLKEIVSTLGQFDLLERFILRCTTIKLRREHFGLPSINEETSHLLTETISLSLSHLKEQPHVSHSEWVAAALSELVKLYPTLTKESVEFVLTCYDKELSPKVDFACKKFLSECDLSEFHLTAKIFKCLISKTDECWAFDSTPFPYLIDWIIREQSDNKNASELLKDLCREAPDAFSGKYLMDFMNRLEKDKDNRGSYLRVVLLICIREGIGLFTMGEEVCFYRNGLHKFKVSDPHWFSETCQDLSKTLLKDLKNAPI